MTKKINKEGVVYSTDPDFEYSYQGEAESETLPNNLQKLKVVVEKASGGKVITKISGFEGKMDDFEELGRELKKHCAVGGSIKDFSIIIQGDFKEKASIYLAKKGYNIRKLNK